MGKADLSRDYYGDLEIHSSATESDIKRQFKKLALKYHPDRNPGRESEVNSKFQTIQSAHEILVDPEQRAKYDSGRRVGGGSSARTNHAHNGFGGTPSGTPSGTRNAKGNPYASAGSYWPPPPKPPPVRKQQPPPTGASRYSNFQTPFAKAQQDAAEAKRKAQASESMRNSQARPQPPPPPRSSYPLYGEYGAPPQPQRSPTRPTPDVPPRKSGYAPGMAGGDEPPAPNSSSYFSTRRTPRAPTARQPPPDLPNRSSRSEPHIDPLRQFRETSDTPYEPRLSTPYATQGGEKTNPFDSINLNRSRSTRERDTADSERARPTSTAASDRHQSASPTRSRPYRPHVDTEFGSHTDPEIHIGSPPKRTYSHVNRSGKASQSPRTETSFRPPTNGSETPSDGDESANDLRQPFGKLPRKPLRANRTQRAQTSGKHSSVPGVNGDRFDETLGRTPSSQGADHISGGPDPSMYDGISTSTPSSVRTPTFHVELNKPHFWAPSTSSSCFATSSSEDCSDRWPNLFSKQVNFQAHSPTRVTPSAPGRLNAFEATQFELLNKLVKRKPGGSASTLRQLSQQGLKSNITENKSQDLMDTGQALKDVNAFHSFASKENCISYVSMKQQQCSSYQSRTLPLLSDLGSPSKKHRLGDISSPGLFSKLRAVGKGNNLYAANCTGDHSFSFKVDEETFTAKSTGPKSFTSSSAENISTTFTPEDWHGKFQAGEDYFGKESLNGASRGSSSSRTRGRSPVKPRAGISKPRVDTRTSYANAESELLTEEQPTMTPGGTKFSAEEWAQTFKPQTFAPPPFPSPGTARPMYNTRSSGRKSRVGSTAGRTHVHKTTMNGAMVDSEGSSSEPIYKESKPKSAAAMNTADVSQGFADSPNAMDIDQPPVGARNVPVEPSRPEWRAGDANGVNLQAAITTHGADANQTKKNTESTDTEDFKTNFEDLKNVEPMANPATGLDSFGDLSSTLPFPSKAANSVPLARSFKTGEIELPNPPRGPIAPSLAQGTTRPSSASWDSYLTVFKAYMAEWDIFNTRMLMHFVSRKNQVDNMPPGWIEAFGDKSIEAYKKGLKEDEKIITHWDTARAKHYNAVEEFVWFRSVVKDGYPKTGGRPSTRIL